MTQASAFWANIKIVPVIKLRGRSNFSEGEIQIERSDFSGVCQKKYSWPQPEFSETLGLIRLAGKICFWYIFFSILVEKKNAERVYEEKGTF